MMGDQLQHFTVTVPVGTPIATPQVTQLQTGIFVVNWVEVESPTGMNGHVGFYLASSGAYWLPTSKGTSPPWVVTSGSEKHWDVTNGPTSGDFQLVAYNTGGFPHTLQVTFDLSVTATTPANPIPSQIPASVLSS